MRRLAAALFLLFTAAASSQEPPRPDPDVEPAQYAEPAPGRFADPPLSPPPGPGGPVADPATPVVRVQVRVPAVVARTAPVKYTITVTNASAATAYRVRVRHPAVESAAAAPKCEPNPDGFNPQVPAKEYAWTFPDLGPGKSKVMTVEYALKPDAKSVRGAAFVSFEHGQSVTTEVDKPKLTVRKSAPESAVAGDAIPVRVEVANAGQVPVEGVVVTETFPAAARFTGDAEAGAQPNQRVFRLGTLRPGERRLIGYKLSTADAAEVLATTAVTARDVPQGEAKESVTKVVTAKLKLDLTGPAQAATGTAAEYVATVTNTGTMPLSTVRVTAAIPEGCTAAAMSAGGRVGRGELAWTGPPDRDNGPLKPGERFEVRFKLRGTRAGEKTVTVAADAGRGAEQSADARTAFAGGAVLRGRAEIEPGATAVGKTGMVTYVVKNAGDGPARGVRLTVAVPPEVSVTQVSPQSRREGDTVAFDATDLPAGDEVTYTLTYKGEKPGRASFTLKLSEAGGRPVESVKEVAITAAGR